MNRINASLRIGVAAAVAAIVVMLGPGSAAAATPAPAWQISTISYPTNFVPGSVNTTNAGPGYQILATNIGAMRTTGPFTVVDTLPPGVTPAPGKPPIGVFGREWLGQEFRNTMTCEVVGQVVTCTASGAGVGPGESVEVKIPLKVEAGVASSIVNQATISGGGAAVARSASTETSVSATPAPFGFLPGGKGFGGLITDQAGDAVTQAGSHPYQMKLDLMLSTEPGEAGKASPLSTGRGVRDAFAILPPGMVANPGATPKCKESVLESAPSACPPESQVGIARFVLGLNAIAAASQAIYNMEPPPGVPAELGFEVIEGTYVHLQGRLRSDGEYELSAGSADILAKVDVLGVQTMLWGSPSDESHDAQRGACVLETHEPVTLCPVDRTNKSFLTMPSACSGPLTTTAEVDSWLEPGIFKTASFESVDPDGNPVGVEDCSALDFEPTLSLTPDVTSADSASGLSAILHVPQNQEYETELGEPQLSGSTLKDARVVLPAGVSVNPSAAGGRTACTAAQIGLTTSVGDPRARFTSAPDTCPDSAKIGSVEVLTPLLQDEPEPGVQVPHPIPGSIYLAQPFDNPFNSLLGVYITIKDPDTGLVVKLAGKVEADPATGQLTSTFRENPQLPFEDFKLNFFGGPRAALKTPALCGNYASTTELTPWSGTASVVGFAPFPVTQGANGAPCVASTSQLPNKPTFDAGTTSPLAGRYSPFVLRMSREDGSQEFAALNVTLPPGLTGKLAGTPYCPEAAIAAAAAKSGRAEQASPSCPSASEVGRVVVGAGAGSSPYLAQGKAYLAGPYKGAPLSMAIVTPAVAGPYDLGTVVVRAAVNVDVFSAEISVKSDPLPTILQGIPLDVRSVAVEIGKPEFTLNPTSCEPKAFSGESLTTTGQSAPLAAHFQVAQCDKLAFKPSLKISLKGGTRRTGHPALKAVVTYPKKGLYSNIARAQVALPHSEFLDQGNLNNVCIQAQLKARTCPAKSIYGRVKAWTPLLDKPLQGNVYLGVGFGHRLPDLVAELNGQIRVLLHGKVDTGPEGGIRNTFEAAPDAPVTKFILEMQGGKKKGLLENSENICHKVNEATVKFVAQNGKVLTTKEPIATSCKGKGAAKSSKRRSASR